MFGELGAPDKLGKGAALLWAFPEASGLGLVLSMESPPPCAWGWVGFEDALLSPQTAAQRCLGKDSEEAKKMAFDGGRPSSWLAGVADSGDTGVKPVSAWGTEAESKTSVP